MGYDQWLSLSFEFDRPCGSREDRNSKIKEALKISDEDWERISILENSDTQLQLNFEWWRGIWVRTGFFGEGEDPVDLKKVSQRSGCRIEIDYVGEDQQDAEKMTIDRGKVMSHKTLEYVEQVKKE